MKPIDEIWEQERQGPDGRQYRTIRGACAAWGVNPDTFRARRNKGMTPIQAFTYPKGSREPGRWVDHLGRRYATKAKLCRAWGVAPSMYDDRLARGWSLKDALTAPKHARRMGRARDAGKNRS